jgi:uncharacterized protein YjbI with pentapeptide repeats
LCDGASSLISFDISLSSHIPFAEPSFFARVWVFFLLACFPLIAHHVGIGADLSGVDLHEANLLEADLIEADLSEANLSGASLSKANLLEADLNRADLSGTDLHSAGLSWANLYRANLYRADLSKANLSGSDDLRTGTNLIEADLTDAELSGAVLRGAGLIRANLSRANLNGVNLVGANLSEANLSEANLSEANLSRANLTGANLTRANLAEANLTWANLTETILTEAWLSGTTLAGINLRMTKGLTSIQHGGQSHIELFSVELPQDGSGFHFLRGIGVPDEWIRYYLATTMYPIQYHFCFISYSSKDEMFATRLHADLQAQGIRCWFAPEDMKIGDRIRQRIDEAIHIHDKVLLVLSEHSVASTWVGNEVEAAFEKERQQSRSVLSPIRLDDTISQTKEAWAATLRRERHIGDFTKWTDPLAYQSAFARLLQDLKQD